MADRRVALLVLGLALAGCASNGSTERTSAPSAAVPSSAAPAVSDAPLPTAPTTLPKGSVTDQSVDMPKAALNLHALPLGTGKSSSAPAAGRLYRCGGTPSGGPPVRIPPWVSTARSTWDVTDKVAVAGSVTWAYEVKASRSGDSLVVTGNGLPHRSGVFPVAQSDPAFAYNPNPTSVLEHDVTFTLPYLPTAAGSVSCETGQVGVAIDGIAILDGFDAGGNDAVGVEVMDTCHGHPNQQGYHYHGLSPCLLDATSRTKTSLVGWALDGFGIYVEYDQAGRLLTNAALDGCHGRMSVVPWHGSMQRIYHYVMTHEFPYTVGCFRGTPVSMRP